MQDDTTRAYNRFATDGDDDFAALRRTIPAMLDDYLALDLFEKREYLRLLIAEARRMGDFNGV